jgi:site-specific recombinase XerD
MAILSNDRELQTAKASKGKPTDFAIRAAPGLRLRVMDTGTRTWSLIYQRNDGKKRRVRIGQYPDMGLKDAKLEAQRLRVEAGDGGDPASATQRQIALDSEQAPLTFKDLANDYLEKYAKPSKRTWRDDNNKLEAYIFPRIGATAASEVTKRDIIHIIDHIAARGALVQADRTKALISSIFNWGRDEDLVQHNPADRIRKRSQRKRRTRLFSHEELRKLWHWCQQPGSPTQTQARVVIQLAILLGQRRNQIAAAGKVELIGLGSERAAFHIPHARLKNKDDLHIVPLPPLAEKLFAKAIEDAGESPFVFPSTSKQGVSLHADTVSNELAKARKALGIMPSDSGEKAVLHGLRHLVKTELRELGIPADVRRRIQSHRAKSSTSDMDEWYSHADDYPADKKALELWEKRLLSIVQISK